METVRRKSYKMMRGPFVLGQPKWEFSTGKKHFTPGKKNRENDFAPSEKFSCDAPAVELQESKLIPV